MILVLIYALFTIGLVVFCRYYGKENWMILKDGVNDGELIFKDNAEYGIQWRRMLNPKSKFEIKKIRYRLWVLWRLED